MGYGVIGSTSDSGSFSLGSSPGTPAQFPYEIRSREPPLCSGLARCPLTAVAPVRIRSGVRTTELKKIKPPLCSGLARCPLTAVAPVRIRSGVPDPPPSPSGRPSAPDTVRKAPVPEATKQDHQSLPPLCSGLARCPLTAVAPVRIRSGVRHSRPPAPVGGLLRCWCGSCRWSGIVLPGVFTGELVEPPLGYGVIGSTSDSGSLSLGSSPGTPARQTEGPKGPFFVSGREYAGERMPASAF